MVKIYPSLIGGNLLCIEQSIKQLEPYCDGFHLDVMDNHFVPNVTFGADMVNAIAQATNKQLWVHLMVDNPRNWCDTLRLAPGSIVSFHIEAAHDHQSITKCITEKKWIPSIAINPKTPVAKILSLLNSIDHVLVMSVEPGFSGQRFLESVLPKVRELKKAKPTITIGMDGGINLENIAQIAAAGAQDLAIASGIFGSDDPVAALQALRKKVNE